MDRLAIHFVLIGLLTCIGCGTKAQVAERSQAAPETGRQTTSNSPAPTDVVSQFLDEVRRGGEDSQANDLLTVQARSELKRIGRSVQPIGSPDARFTVTRAENIPGEENSALVHSVWSEPDGNGNNSDFQVVWAVEKEAAEWRISGLAMELEAGADPVIIDFENGDLMAQLLAEPQQLTGDSGTESQAVAPNPTFSR